MFFVASLLYLGGILCIVDDFLVHGRSDKLLLKDKPEA
jgi:hypothetical protein